jgi:hypothetical protein
VVCLDGSFDDSHAARALPEAERLWITTLQADRRSIWIEANHDPGLADLGGAHLSELYAALLTFRHSEACETIEDWRIDYNTECGVVSLTRTSLQHRQMRRASGDKKPAPFEEGGITHGFEGLSSDDVAIEIEVVEDGGVGGGELLQVRHSPEPGHCPLSSPATAGDCSQPDY